MPKGIHNSLRGPQKNIETRQRALGMWLTGMTFTDIAKEMGVSRQWVQEMLTPPPALRKATYARAQGKCQVCGMHLGRNAHYHSEPTGPIEDFSKPLVMLCCACHRQARQGRL